MLIQDSHFVASLLQYVWYACVSCCGTSQQLHKETEHNGWSIVAPPDSPLTPPLLPPPPLCVSGSVQFNTSITVTHRQRRSRVCLYFGSTSVVFQTLLQYFSTHWLFTWSFVKRMNRGGRQHSRKLKEKVGKLCHTDLISVITVVIVHTRWNKMTKSGIWWRKKYTSVSKGTVSLILLEIN